MKREEKNSSGKKQVSFYKNRQEWNRTTDRKGTRHQSTCGRQSVSVRACLCARPEEREEEEEEHRKRGLISDGFQVASRVTAIVWSAERLTKSTV